MFSELYLLFFMPIFPSYKRYDICFLLKIENTKNKQNKNKTVFSVFRNNYFNTFLYVFSVTSICMFFSHTWNFFILCMLGFFFILLIYMHILILTWFNISFLCNIPSWMIYKLFCLSIDSCFRSFHLFTIIIIQW